MAVRRHTHYMRWLYIVLHKKFLFGFIFLCLLPLRLLPLRLLPLRLLPLRSVFVLPPELGFRRHVCEFGSFNGLWLWFWFDGCRVFESLCHCHGLCRWLLRLWWLRLWWLKRLLIGLIGLRGLRGLRGILFLGQCAKWVALWIVDVIMNVFWLFFGLRFQWREVVIFVLGLWFGFEHGGHEFQFGFRSNHWTWIGKHDGWLSALLIALIALIASGIGFRLITVSARVSGSAAVQAGLIQQRRAIHVAFFRFHVVWRVFLLWLSCIKAHLAKGFAFLAGRVFGFVWGGLGLLLVHCL